MCGRCLAGFFGTSVLPVGDALTDCCSGSRLPGIEHSSGRAWTFPLGDPCLVSAFVTACSSPEPRAPGAILHFRRLGAAPLRAVLRIRAVRPNLNRRKRATSRWPGAGPTRASVRAGRFAPHTTTSPTRLSPPPLCTGRRSGRPCAAAPRPGAISYPHRLGAVLLRAVLRIRAARSDRRRRATFRWPGAGPTRAAVWAGRCAPTTTTPPARLSLPPPCAGCSSGRPGTVASRRSRTSTSSAPCRCRPSSASGLCALIAGGAPPSAGPAPGLRGPPPGWAVRPEYDYFADATVTSAAVRV